MIEHTLTHVASKQILEIILTFHLLSLARSPCPRLLKCPSLTPAKVKRHYKLVLSHTCATLDTLVEETSERTQGQGQWDRVCTMNRCDVIGPSLHCH